MDGSIFNTATLDSVLQIATTVGLTIAGVRASISELASRVTMLDERVDRLTARYELDHPHDEAHTTT